MPGDRIGRAVLELSTDSKSFFSDVDQAEKRVVTLKGAFEKAKPSLDLLARGMSDAGKAASASSKLIEGMGSAGRQSLQQLEQPASTLSLKFVALGAAAGTFVANLATQGLQQFGAALLQTAADGAKFSALSPAFDRLTKSLGETSGAMLAMTRGATKGLISDLELMQATNKAVLLGLPVTSAEMGKLAQTAVTLGRAMGQDATSSLNDLITALGRSSPMILDNLGLTVKVGEANEEYAKKLGKTADSLTEAEKKTAFYQAAMQAAERKTNDLGDVQLTLSEQFQRVTVSIGNVITSLVAAANQSDGVVSWMKTAADTAERWASSLSAVAEASRRLGGLPGASIGGPQGAATGAGIAGIDNILGKFGLSDVENETRKIMLERALEAAQAGGKMGRPTPVPIGAAFSGLDTQSPLDSSTLDLATTNLKIRLDKQKEADAKKKAAEEERKAIAKAQAEQVDDFHKLNEEIDKLLEKQEEIDKRDMLDRISEGNQLFSERIDKLQEIADNVEALGNAEQTNKPSFLLDFEKRQKGFSLSGLLKDNLGPTLMQAITGGGNLVQSIGGLVGGGLTEKFFGANSALTKSLTGGLSKALGSTIGGALGSVLPGIGALAGPAIEGIGKLFGKLFGSEGKKVNDLRDNFIDSAGGIRVLAEQARLAGTSVDALLKAGKVKDFEKAVDDLQKKLGQFTNEQEADAQRLQAAIQKYGFTFEQLGPAFQRQRLDEQAKELIEDWRVLVASGIDLTLVNEKMSEAINGYVQQAIKVGIELPNAFKPIIQKMLEQGVLTDEAGNAITDLESAGIHFSETMTEGFDRVVQKLDELITKLQAAGTAIGNLPSVPTTVPTPGGDTGYIDPNTYPAFASGGLALGPTFGVFGEKGPEAVVPLDRLEGWIASKNGSGAMERQLDALIGGIAGMRRDLKLLPTQVTAAAMARG